MRFLTIFIVILFTLSVADAQSVKTDLTGKWVLDEKKSKIADGFWNYELVIVHTDPELKITHRSLVKGQDKSAEVIYFTDRRGEKSFPYAYYPNVEDAAPVAFAVPRVGVAIALRCVAFFLLPQPKPRYKPGEEPNEAEKLKE